MASPRERNSYSYEQYVSQVSASMIASVTTPERALPIEHENAWRSWLRAHALLVRTLDADLRHEHYMTLLTYDALVQLSEAPNRQLYMKELADALVYSASGVTRIVDGLERDGYARRETDPVNRRATRVILTTAGLAALEAAWPTHVRGVTKHFVAHSNDKEASALARVFGLIANELARRPKEPPVARSGSARSPVA